MCLDPSDKVQFYTRNIEPFSSHRNFPLLKKKCLPCFSVRGPNSIPSKHITAENAREGKLLPKQRFLQKEVSAFPASAAECATTNSRPRREQRMWLQQKTEQMESGIGETINPKKSWRKQERRGIQQLWRWQRMIKHHNSQLQVGRGQMEMHGWSNQCIPEIRESISWADGMQVGNVRQAAENSGGGDRWQETGRSIWFSGRGTCSKRGD